MTRHRRRRTDRLRLIEAALDALAVVATETHDGQARRPMIEHAVARLNAASPAWPSAAAHDGAGGRAAPGSKPPPGWGRPDPARHDLGELNRALRDLDRSARAVLDIVRRWAPRDPDPAAKRDAAAENDPACTSCHAEPEHRSGLGRFCYDFKGRAGRLPTRSELLRHEQGGRVRLPSK